MFCVTCGSSIEPNSRFCANCGVAVAVPRMPAPAAVPTVPAEPFAPAVQTVPPEPAESEYTTLSLVEAEENSDPPIYEKLAQIAQAAESRQFTEPPTSYTRESFFDEAQIMDAPLPEFPHVTVHENAVPMSPSGYEQHGEGNPPAPDLSAKNSAEQKEQYFFGKGAFVLCLILIGILSVTAAMFMGLYAHELGGFGKMFS